LEFALFVKNFRYQMIWCLNPSYIATRNSQLAIQKIHATELNFNNES